MRGKQGFTMVEVLLSIAILSIVAAAVYRVFALSVKAEERVNQRLRANLEIVSALDRIDKDLNNVVLSGGFKADSEGVIMHIVDGNKLKTIRYGRNEDGDFIRDASGKEDAILKEYEMGSVSFSFGCLHPDGGILWRERWDSDYLPFAVRWQAQIPSGVVERTFYIPQGEWGRL